MNRTIILIFMVLLAGTSCKKPEPDVIYIHLPDEHESDLSAKILNILYCGTNPLVAEDVDNVSFAVDFHYSSKKDTCDGSFHIISLMQGEPAPNGMTYAGSDDFEFNWVKISDTEVSITMKHADDMMHIDNGSRAYAMNQFNGVYTMENITFGVPAVKYTKTGFVNPNDCSIEFIRSNQ